MTSLPQPQLLTPEPQGPTVARAAVWLLVVVLVGGGGGRAEPPLAARLQRTLDRERVAQDIPGAAAAVVAGGRLVWVARAARRTCAVDAGAPGHAIRDRERDQAFPGARGITLRQLLDQTSGSTTT